MRISYVTHYDALDIHKWSGLGYYMSKSLESPSTEIDYITLQIELNLMLKLKARIYKQFGQSFDFNRTPNVAKQCSKQIQSLLKSDSDVVFAPSSIYTATLETKTPKVFYTDATLAGLIGFYDDYSKLSSETIRNGNRLEQKALDSAALAIYSSDWAAQTAINNYKVDANKVRVVPFGANIECNRSLNDIKSIVSNRSKSECNLLFLGVDWTRKGGDLAVKIAEELNKQGLKTKLHVAGIKNIPLSNLPDFVIDYGFISKSSIDGQNKLNKLMAESHFLLLPTLADCTPVVYSEANSYGLPCISTNVGGIPTIIKEDINGKLFSPLNNEQDYAQYIQTTFCDFDKYNQLALSSFNEYSSRLNWETSGKLILSMLREL
jgi:glycosyltransferase involved in cell wall biosynthesis